MYIKSFLDYLEKVLGGICVICFIVMFVLGVATVVFRFLIQSSLAFPDELIRYLFVWIIALGTAIGLRRNIHAAIGLFVDMLPGGLKRLILLFSTLCTGTFLAILIVKGIVLTARASTQISPALEVSMAWVYSAIPVGAAFCLIYVIESFVLQLTQPDSDPVSEDY